MGGAPRRYTESKIGLNVVELCPDCDESAHDLDDFHLCKKRTSSSHLQTVEQTLIYKRKFGIDKQ